MNSVYLLSAGVAIGLIYSYLAAPKPPAPNNTKDARTTIHHTPLHQFHHPPPRSKKRRKLRFDISFDGTNYSGWQYHPNTALPALYTVVTAAWVQATGESGFGPVATRLDAGVSANQQICSVRTQHNWTPEQLQHVLINMNHALPKDIRCLLVKKVPIKFHAINVAKWKRYGYVVSTSESRGSTAQRCWYRAGKDIDVQLTLKALSTFIGCHDFRRFTKDDGPWASDDEREGKTSLGKSAKRSIYAVTAIKREDGAVHLTVQGNGFMKHMVRRLVGVAVGVGAGELSVADVLVALGRDEEKWTTTHTQLSKAWRCFEAPANGLTLEEIGVDGRFE